MNTKTRITFTIGTDLMVGPFLVNPPIRSLPGLVEHLYNKYREERGHPRVRLDQLKGTAPGVYEARFRSGLYGQTEETMIVRVVEHTKSPRRVRRAVR